jgi:hypothetical protein
VIIKKIRVPVHGKHIKVLLITAYLDHQPITTPTFKLGLPIRHKTFTYIYNSRSEVDRPDESEQVY